jgi:hypothetical protein
MNHAEYYRIRLDHTIQYTQQATRLIYFVSGAILLGFYFVVEKGQQWAWAKGIGIGLLIILAAINFIHGLILVAQRDWYHRFDEALAKAAENAPVIRRDPKKISVHYFFAAIHWIVAAGIIALAIVLILQFFLDSPGPTGIIPKVRT